MTTKTLLAAAFLLALSMNFALASERNQSLNQTLLCVPQSSSIKQLSDDERTTWNWVMRDNGWRQEVRIEGPMRQRTGNIEDLVRLTDDDTDILELAPDVTIRVIEERGSIERRITITRAAGSELQRRYLVNGEAHAFDAEARAWLASMLLKAVRQGGLDARNRVQRILRQRGVSGVMDEIAQIQSDYAKRIYFEALIQNANLNTSALQMVFQQVARQIGSDYEKSTLLIESAGQLLNKEAAAPEFFEAVGRIGSDYEHHRVLTSILKKGSPSQATHARMLQSASAIKSDYEKASFLIEAATQYLNDGSVRAAYFNALNSIHSDYEHHRVLTALIKNSSPRREVLAEILRSATAIQSDYEKAGFLIDAANLYVNDASLKPSFMNSVQTINSDYERGRVLSVLLKKNQIP